MALETSEYITQFEVRWADLDPNRHLRHTAYHDYATHVRFRYLSERGFDATKFAELQIGPVVFREETQFFKEVRMNQVISVNFLVAGLAHDVSRWKLHHDIMHANGSTAASIRLEGAWLDIAKRKLTAPPPELARVFWDLPKTADYQEIPLKNKG